PLLSLLTLLRAVTGLLARLLTALLALLLTALLAIIAGLISLPIAVLTVLTFLALLSLRTVQRLHLTPDAFGIIQRLLHRNLALVIVGAAPLLCSRVRFQLFQLVLELVQSPSYRSLAHDCILTHPSSQSLLCELHLSA